MNSVIIKYIYIFVFLLFTVIIIYNIKNYYKKDITFKMIEPLEMNNNFNKELNQELNQEINNEVSSLDFSSSFCNDIIKNTAKCTSLSKKNCNSVSCCIWTNDEQCVEGDINGPTFNTDENGKTKDINYYYYKNKCYGPKCS